MTSIVVPRGADTAFSAPPVLPSAFDSPDGEAAYLAAYDANMHFWPIPYETLDVTSRFGRTHLVVSGPAHAPPLVLLHGYGAGLIGAPTRVRKIVLLSPAGGFEPLSEEFYRRSALTLATPTREVAADFLRWAAQEDVPGDAQMLERFERLIDQFHLGVRHFRREYFEAALPPGTFSDDELRATRVPTLLLIGDREPIYDSAAAVARARRLLPNVEAALVPRSSHMMCLSQARAVDARILAFLKW